MSWADLPYATASFSSWVTMSESIEEEETEDTTNTFYTDMRDGWVPELLATMRTGVCSLVRRAVQAGSNPLKAGDITEYVYARDAAVLGFPSQFIDNARIQSSDLRAIIGANDLAVTPLADDTFIVDGVRHHVVNVEAWPAGGPAVAYALQIRRA